MDYTRFRFFYVVQVYRGCYFSKAQKPVPVSGSSLRQMVAPDGGQSSNSAVYRTVDDLRCPPATVCCPFSLKEKRAWV